MNFNRRATRFADWCRARLLPIYIAPYWLLYRLKRFALFYWPAFRRAPAAERKSLGAMVRDLLRLRARVITYFHYGLYRRDAVVSGSDYLNETHFYYGICYGRGRNHVVLDDKVVFERICRSAALPTPRLFVYTTHNTILRVDGTSITTEAEFQAILSSAPDELIVKPSVGSSGGAGVVRYQRRAGAVFVANDLKLEARTLAMRMGREDVLVQEGLRNHDAFSMFRSDALLCLRVMTVFGRGRALVPCGLLKIAAPAQVADNGATGGLYVAIDMSTGRLESWGTNERLEVVVTPGGGSGPRFDTFVVPRFEEVLAILTRAAAVFADLPVIGWDVAVTASGIVLVEGNSSPSLAMVMKSHRGAAALRRAMEDLL